MEDASLANTCVGTLSDLSPERIAGNSYAYPSDIWSFGLTILTVALGRYPYSTDGGYWGLLHSLRDEPSPHLPDDGSFSRNFQDFVDSCLRKDPAERPSTQKLLDHPFLIGCKENMEARRRAARQRREAGGNPTKWAARRPEESSIKYAAHHGPKVRAMEEGAEESADVDQQHRFPRIQRRGLATLADQLGIPLDIVARRFEQNGSLLREMAKMTLTRTEEGTVAAGSTRSTTVKHRKK